MFKSSTKYSLHLKKNQKNQKEFEKNDKVLGDIIKNWEMGLGFY